MHHLIIYLIEEKKKTTLAKLRLNSIQNNVNLLLPSFQERTVWMWAIGQWLKVIECTHASNAQKLFSVGNLDCSVFPG